MLQVNFTVSVDPSVMSDGELKGDNNTHIDEPIASVLTSESHINLTTISTILIPFISDGKKLVFFSLVLCYKTKYYISVLLHLYM